jgi:hypothetical protein
MMEGPNRTDPEAGSEKDKPRTYYGTPPSAPPNIPQQCDTIPIPIDFRSPLEVPRHSSQQCTVQQITSPSVPYCSCDQLITRHWFPHSSHWPTLPSTTNHNQELGYEPFFSPTPISWLAGSVGQRKCKACRLAEAIIPSLAK